MARILEILEDNLYEVGTSKVIPCCLNLSQSCNVLCPKFRMETTSLGDCYAKCHVAESITFGQITNPQVLE